ncbi:MAG: 50S ribosomal protein L25 [bacterium]
MKEIALVAQKRDSGKTAAKLIRTEGLIPGVYYRKGSENINIVVEPVNIRSIVYTSNTKLVALSIEGINEPLHCVLKDVTFDPVSDKITHFDLLGIKKDQKLTVQVPLKLVGLSPGVRAGGRLQQTLHKVKVTCYPDDLVEHFDVDLSTMNMGDTFYLRDLKNVERIEFDIQTNTPVCSVTKPRGGTKEA